MKAIVQQPGENSTLPRWNSRNIRIKIWQAVGSIFDENPLWGVGTGDARDALLATFEAQSFQYGINKKFNGHNQYGETLVKLGLSGLIPLITLFFASILLAIRTKNYFSIAVISLMGLSKRGNVPFWA